MGKYCLMSTLKNVKYGKVLFIKKLMKLRPFLQSLINNKQTKLCY